MAHVGVFAMETPHLSGSIPRDWKVLYRAAIVETNSSLILQKVSTAEAAALARQRELFYRGGTQEEKESLEDALYALRAFRTAVQHAQDA
jgi:hypothetical protein